VSGGYNEYGVLLAWAHFRAVERANAQAIARNGPLDDERWWHAYHREYFSRTRP
jgi:hypothetical protein